VFTLFACTQTDGSHSDSASTSGLSRGDVSETTGPPANLDEGDGTGDLDLRAYPYEVEQFLVDVIPRVSMADNFYVLSTVGCNDLRLDGLASRWEATSPTSLSREALEMNYQLSVRWGVAEDSDPIALLQREAAAFGRHCDNVIAASARHREVLNTILANSSSKPASQWQAEIVAAIDGRSALVSESRRIYDREREYSFQYFLRRLACDIAKSYPDQQNQVWKFSERLYLEWDAYATNAFAIWHFAETNFYGRSPLMTPDAAKGFWVENNWQSAANFEVWLCGA
jgi:hypothetical protein